MCDMKEGKKILTAVFFMVSYLGFSQNPCGTEQSKDLNFSPEKLQAFIQAEKASRSSADYVYPISAHVFQHDFGFGGLNENVIIDAISTMNDRYAPLGIEFYLCGAVTYIDRTDLWDFDSSEESELTPFLVPNTINIFFARDVISSSGRNVCGYSNFPWYSDDFILMASGCTANGATLSHELGHYFGLLHTHSPGELVNRINCSFAGDECCDTPADPTLDDNNVNQNCDYIGTETDFNGDPYTPQVENIMSYAPSQCRNAFTNDQRNRARYYAANDRNYFSCNVSSVEENQMIDVRIYPNPTTNSLTIQSNESIKSIVLYDLSQKLVGSYTVSLTNSTVIATDHLNKGTYLLTINLVEGGSITKRITKI